MNNNTNTEIEMQDIDTNELTDIEGGGVWGAIGCGLWGAFVGGLTNTATGVAAAIDCYY